jgi:hypothetical protein
MLKRYHMSPASMKNSTWSSDDRGAPTNEISKETLWRHLVSSSLNQLLFRSTLSAPEEEKKPVHTPSLYFV